MQADGNGKNGWDHREIVSLLRQCGKIAMGHYGRTRTRLKSDRSPVTQADEEVEALLVSRLHRPTDGVHVIGEESAMATPASEISAALRGTAYVVDPIDGTAPYASQLPFWGISIGLLRAGQFADGAIYLPALGELYVTAGERILHFDEAGDETEVVPKVPEWTDAGMIAITQAIAKRGGVDLPNPVQALSCAVLPLVSLVRGRYLGYVGDLSLWDLAGGVAMLRRAGCLARLFDGTVLDAKVDGRCFRLDEGDERRFKTRSPVLFAANGEHWARIAGRLRFG